MWLYFIPLYIAGAIIFMFALFALLGRFKQREHEDDRAEIGRAHV